MSSIDGLADHGADLWSAVGLPTVLAWCQRWVRSRQDAEELAQDALLLAFIKRDTLLDERATRSWFRTTVRNLCWNHNRLKRESLDDSDGAWVDSVLDLFQPSTDTRVHDQRAQRHVDALLHDRPDNERLAFWMRYGCHSDEDICQELGLGDPRAVRVHLQNARRYLRARLPPRLE